MIKSVRATVTYNTRGVPSYQATISHPGLSRSATFKASDEAALKLRVDAQLARWDEIWQRAVSRERRANTTAEKKQLAEERTEEAQAQLRALDSLLTEGLDLDPAIDWDHLKDSSRYGSRRPQKKDLGAPPKPIPPPPAPDRIKPLAFMPERSDPPYRSTLDLLDRLIPSFRRAKLERMEKLFASDLEAWHSSQAEIVNKNREAETLHRDATKRIEELNLARSAEYEANCQAVEEEHRREGFEYERNKAAFYEAQKLANAEVDLRHALYGTKDANAIIEYCESILNNAEYPPSIPSQFDLGFNPDTGVLIVDLQLPGPDDLPKVSEIKYVKASDTYSEKLLSEAQQNRIYDDVVYRLALRTLHNLFRADSVGAIMSIVFNGIVTSIDKATGNETTACILSLQALKEKFLAINLAKVDPKACFRQLRGVGSSKLHSVTAVAPIMELDRSDPRFVPALAISQRLSVGYNLALMDWEDFEHLIREIFEKEFEYAGGEVKVTQTSRDGGVDAVAFDPDPIRGGKIVIQAKRWANTVGVAAVRDLYGTVMNEGASKGILVTTSDYGPDAYEFAKLKPLTLLSGSNLLHLLEKHGVRAHINLQEARTSMPNVKGT